MAQVLQIIGIVIAKTIKYWGMPLLGALLWLGFSWVSYGILLWPEALLVFLIVFMLNYSWLQMRKYGRGKYSRAMN